jgi:hypothetical protein
MYCYGNMLKEEVLSTGCKSAWLCNCNFCVWLVQASLWIPLCVRHLLRMFPHRRVLWNCRKLPGLYEPSLIISTKCTNSKIHTNLCKNSFRLITPWIKFLLDKLMVTHLVKKCTMFYWIRSFITVFPTACFWSLCWARWIHSTTTHPFALRYILNLYFPLWLGLPRGLVPSGYLSKISYAVLISPIYVTTSR